MSLSFFYLSALHTADITAPVGGQLFRYGFAILTWSLPGLAFAVFTFANLAPRALANHKWYLKNFPDYPKDRKALVPFVL